MHAVRSTPDMVWDRGVTGVHAELNNGLTLVRFLNTLVQNTRCTIESSGMGGG